MKKRNEKLGLKERHSSRSRRDQHTVKKRSDDSVLLEGSKGKRNTSKQKHTALKLIAETETPAGYGGTLAEVGGWIKLRSSRPAWAAGSRCTPEKNKEIETQMHLQSLKKKMETVIKYLRFLSNHPMILLRALPNKKGAEQINLIETQSAFRWALMTVGLQGWGSGMGSW